VFIYSTVYNFLTQNVTSPTRARGEDTPHILDLVISNDNFIDDIDYCAPLGKSDHASLVIKCIWQSKYVDILDILDIISIKETMLHSETM